jgi:type I restriction enzyme S subunit
MNDVGVLTKIVQTEQEKPLKDVIGNYTYFADDDVLLAKITPCFENGKLGIVRGLTNGIGFGSSEFLVLRSRGELDPEFLFYFLAQDSFRDVGARRMTGAVGHKRIPKEFVEEYRLCLPSLAEQKRIVAILDEAFTGIAAAITNAEKNLASAHELFEIYRNLVFTQRGEGWTEKRFAAIASIKHGFPFQSKHFGQEGSYVLLTPGNFYETGGYRDRGKKQKYYSGPVPDGYVLQRGDMLLAMTEQAAGLLGSPAIVPEDQLFLHNQRLGLVVPHEETPWCNRFFFHAFNTTAFRRKVHDDASGVKVRHTSPKKLGDVKLAFPQSLAQQIAVANRLDECARQTSALEVLGQRKLSALAELKQSILQKAFAGELTANEAERELAAA